MPEIIGRFLSFEDHLGRGLVKFAYYLILFFVLVTHIFWLLRDIFTWHPGAAIIVLCQALLWVIVTRVVAELILAVLSIDDSLQNGTSGKDGFEAGITPTPGTSSVDTPQAAQDPKPSTDTETPDNA